MQRFHFLFLQHGDLRFLARHQRLFLREVEVRGYAVLELGFDDDEDALAVFDVFLRQRHALAQRQHVEIGGRHVRHRCQRHAFLGVSGRAQQFFRGTQIVPRKAPEIERVARIGAELRTNCTLPAAIRGYRSGWRRTAAAFPNPGGRWTGTGRSAECWIGPAPRARWRPPRRCPDCRSPLGRSGRPSPGCRSRATIPWPARRRHPKGWGP